MHPRQFRSVSTFCTVVAVTAFATTAHGQPHPENVNPGFFTATNWCADTGTLCWADPKKLQSFTGIRFVGEPNTGGLSQSGDNRVESGSLVGLIKAGAEVNLYGSAVAIQGSFIPQSTVTLDADSRLVTSGQVNKDDRKMGINYGYTFGLSLVNGIVAVGYGNLKLDTRRLTNPASSDKNINFFYVNLQPISTIRAAIGGTQATRKKGNQ